MVFAPCDVVIDRLLLFGATGDLAGRFLLPALADLFARGLLPGPFEIVGAAQRELSDEEFQRSAGERLEQHASDIPQPAREVLLRRLKYRQIDLGPDSRTDLTHDVLSGFSNGQQNGAKPVASYLALPPRLFAPAIEAVRGAHLPAGSRLIVEKPFGDDLGSAVALNRRLAEMAGKAGEDAVFRVDHVLGMATVHNLLAVRLANRVLEPLWNSTYIEQVEILWEETLALEGRAGYYDRVGALKDVVQNHMVQILALVAMEPPASLGERELRDRKVEVLRTVRAPSQEQMRTRTRRARYTAGQLAATGGATGDDVPDYIAEDGVDPSRNTETFAEVVLDLETPRWAGTRFVMRTGKAFHRRWKGVVVRFREVAHSPFDKKLLPAQNELRIGLDGPETLSLHLTGSTPGPPAELAPLVLTAQPPVTGLRAYSQVLLDILSGDSTLSIRGDEAEEAWRIMAPVMKAWSENVVPMEEYPAGSSGPARRSRSLNGESP